MDLKAINNVYFIGVGGIGMSALARYFVANNFKVAGYDKTSSSLTDELKNDGVTIHFEDNIKNIPLEFRKENTLVIYTPAIPADHNELNYFKTHKFEIVKRAKALGIIASQYRSLCIAGTHGKTTTSSILAAVLAPSSINTNAFLGGICNNFDSNLLLTPNASHAVVEADEFDRSFLQLNPSVAVITSTDADHLDIYGHHSELLTSFQEFANKLEKDGILIKRFGLKISAQNVFTYGFNTEADYHVTNIIVDSGKYIFDVKTPKSHLQQLQLGIGGLHNIENALAVIAVCDQIGLNTEQIKSGLAGFKGVKRRFDVRVKNQNLVFIDDYAHHPEELRACIGSVKSMYPGKKITGIFQPHLYSRTRDFAQEFAQSLSLLDELIMLDIYPARELPIPGITSASILSNVTCTEKSLVSKDEAIASLKNKKIEVLLTLGAGDIDRMVEPICKELERILTEKGIALK